MREINYLKKRFEFAMKNSKPQKGSFGTIHINANDIIAINSLIAYRNKNYSSQLEDSLLLFWVLANWKIELQNQNLILSDEPNGFMKITDIKVLLDALCLRLQPKINVINEITTMLQAQQKVNNIPVENQVTFEFVSEELEKILKLVKENFTPISQLKKYPNFKYN